MKRGLVRKFWIGATLLIIVLTAFAAGRNLIHAFKIRSQIRVLERVTGNKNHGCRPI